MAENSAVALLVALATFTHGNIDIGINTHAGTEIEIEMRIERHIHRHTYSGPSWGGGGTGALDRPGVYEGMNVF